MDYLDGVGQIPDIARAQQAVSDGCSLPRHPLLHLAIAAELPQAVGESGRGGVVTREEKREQVATDLLVAERSAGDRIGELEEQLDQSAPLPVSPRAASIASWSVSVTTANETRKR